MILLSKHPSCIVEFKKIILSYTYAHTHCKSCGNMLTGCHLEPAHHVVVWSFNWKFCFCQCIYRFVVPHWCWCETIKCVWQQVPSLPPVYGATQRLSQTNRLVQSSLDHFQNPRVPSGPVSEEQPTNGPFSVDSRWGGPASHSEELLVSPDTENESAFICQPSGLQWAFLCT